MEPELFYIGHDRFLADVEAVAKRIEADAWRPDFLVGIGRGGLVPAAYLSHRTGIAMLSVDLSSGEAGFADELLAKLAAKMVQGLNILIVDDINDSGTTIAFLRDAIAAYGGIADRLRVAVLINNVRSGARADYWSEAIDRAEDKRWFVFPWEAVAPREELVSAAREVPERLA
jgi:hypoxanthine phosphoribosyltransferase